MEHGRFAESGSHAEWVDAGGLYPWLWNAWREGLVPRCEEVGMIEAHEPRNPLGADRLAAESPRAAHRRVAVRARAAPTTVIPANAGIPFVPSTHGRRATPG